MILWSVPPVHVFCNNQNAIQLTKNVVFHKRSKHINIQYHFTREFVEKNEIKIIYLKIDLMLADVFTKALPKIKHDRAVIVDALVPNFKFMLLFLYSNNTPCVSIWFSTIANRLFVDRREFSITFRFCFCLVVAKRYICVSVL